MLSFFKGGRLAFLIPGKVCPSFCSLCCGRLITCLMSILSIIAIDSILSMIAMDGTYDQKLEFGRRSENQGNKESVLLRKLGMLALGRKTKP